MAKQIDSYYVVKVMTNGEMLNENTVTYDRLSSAKSRASEIAKSGTYAEVRQIIINERCIERFEP